MQGQIHIELRITREVRPILLLHLLQEEIRSPLGVLIQQVEDIPGVVGGDGRVLPEGEGEHDAVALIAVKLRSGVLGDSVHQPVDHRGHLQRIGGDGQRGVQRVTGTDAELRHSNGESHGDHIVVVHFDDVAAQGDLGVLQDAVKSIRIQRGILKLNALPGVVVPPLGEDLGQYQPPVPLAGLNGDAVLPAVEIEMRPAHGDQLPEIADVILQRGTADEHLILQFPELKAFVGQQELDQQIVGPVLTGLESIRRVGQIIQDRGDLPGHSQQQALSPRGVNLGAVTLQNDVQGAHIVAHCTVGDLKHGGDLLAGGHFLLGFEERQQLPLSTVQKLFFHRLPP